MTPSKVIEGLHQDLDRAQHEGSVPRVDHNPGAEVLLTEEEIRARLEDIASKEGGVAMREVLSKGFPVDTTADSVLHRASVAA